MMLVDVFFSVALVALLRASVASGQECSSTLSSALGVIQSPGYPIDYPEDITCSWQILVASNFFVELSIEEFSIEVSEGCQRASLSVYDGINSQATVLLSPSCGERISWPSHPTNVLSSGQVMTVLFTTSASTRYNETGFRATYRQVSPREDIFLAVDATNRIIYKQNRFGVNSDRVEVVGLANPVAIDYDSVEEKVYFSDVLTKHIGRCDIDGRNQETIATTLVDVPDGLAVDPVSRLIYWTDASEVRPMISVARLDGSYRRILFDDGVDKPRAIVIHNGEGTIYWSDWGTFSKIEKANGDGTNRKGIVTSGLGWPNGISLDIAGGKLYWADAQLNRIERCNLDGSRREQLKVFSGDIHPFGLIFRDNTLFWSDWMTEGIDVADSNLQEDPTTLIVAGVPTRFHGLAFYSSSDPPIDMRDCSLGERNSGCEELCVPLPSGASCLAVAPVFENCPEDIFVISNQVEIVEWKEPTVTSPSNVEVRLSSSHTGPTLSVAPNDGNITVTYIATDELGNTARCTFYIIATYDTTPPRPICPTHITEEMSRSQGVVSVTWDEPQATDDTGPVNLIFQSHESGDTFEPGLTTVTYRYEDVAGNGAECQFQVEVIVRSAPTTAPTEGTPGTALDMMTVIVISAVVVIFIILTIVVSFVLGRCVTCQCRACKRDEQPNTDPAGLVVNPGFSPPTIKLHHPAAPPPPHNYATHLGSPPVQAPSSPAQYGRHSGASRIYQEIDQEIDPPVYSQNLLPNESPVYDRGISHRGYMGGGGDQGGLAPEPPAYSPHYSRDLDGAGYLQLEDPRAAPSQCMPMVGDVNAQ